MWYHTHNDITQEEIIIEAREPAAAAEIVSQHIMNKLAEWGETPEDYGQTIDVSVTPLVQQGSAFVYQGRGGSDLILMPATPIAAEPA